MTESDLGWLMGFFDGEGCISASLPRERLVLKVNVTNTVPDACEAFAAVWGGRVRVMKRGGARKEQYGWDLYGRSAIPFLRVAAGELRVKKPQAELALELALLIGESGVRVRSPELTQRRHDLVAAIQAINSPSRKEAYTRH